MKVELRATEQKLEMEAAAKTTHAKLHKLKITQFKGTSSDWVRLENIFSTQVDRQPIPDEEKFGYLLEMVIPKVRERISNLKPGSLGYKLAWERLKKEFGQTKLVINAHMDEIINLTPEKGNDYDKVREFYKKLSNNFDALNTLGKADSLKEFVMTTLKKLPKVKSDLVRIDEKWEEWGMEKLIDNLQQWLKRNKSEDSWESGNNRRKERALVHERTE